MTKFAPWDAATRCTDGPGKGSTALMKVLLQRHPKGKSLGIFNCRSVRGGSTTSKHGEGRALDVGFPMKNGRGSDAGYALVNELLKGETAVDLGIQAIIYDRKIWSAKDVNGRPYTGVAPHYDHVHIELTRSAAANLTEAKIKAVLGGTKPAPKPTPKPEPEKPLWERKPVLKRGMTQKAKTSDIALVQRFIGTPDDGIFGPATERQVKHYQGIVGLPKTGVVNAAMWKSILRSLKLA